MVSIGPLSLSLESIAVAVMSLHMTCTMLFVAWYFTQPTKDSQ